MSLQYRLSGIPRNVKDLIDSSKKRNIDEVHVLLTAKHYERAMLESYPGDNGEFEEFPKYTLTRVDAQTAKNKITLYQKDADAGYRLNEEAGMLEGLLVAIRAAQELEESGLRVKINERPVLAFKALMNGEVNVLMNLIENSQTKTKLYA